VIAKDQKCCSTWPDHWNDVPDRTAEEVIDTLIAAAYW
jgi:hypothetical protein